MPKRRQLHRQKIRDTEVRAPAPARTQHRGDLVEIQTTDPNCHGVTGSRGERYDVQRGGVIAMPRREAERILRSGHPEVGRYLRLVGFHDADIWGPDGKLRRGPEEGSE